MSIVPVILYRINTYVQKTGIIVYLVETIIFWVSGSVELKTIQVLQSWEFFYNFKDFTIKKNTRISEI